MTENQLPEGSVPLAQSLSVGAEAKPALKLTYEPAKPIEIELPNGMVIGMAKPNSISRNLASIMADYQYSTFGAMEAERKRAECLLYITTIDGEDEPKIADPIMRAHLEQRIGIENLDALLLVWAENFPPTDPAVLKVVKK
jgi:hypothetical protein